MPRTTITLSEERYRALKQVAARRGQTITEVVDRALELAGVNTVESVREMLAAASGVHGNPGVHLATGQDAPTPWPGGQASAAKERARSECDWVRGEQGLAVESMTGLDRRSLRKPGASCTLSSPAPPRAPSNWS